jgi:hypothetical protein
MFTLGSYILAVMDWSVSSPKRLLLQNCSLWNSVTGTSRAGFDFKEVGNPGCFLALSISAQPAHFGQFLRATRFHVSPPVSFGSLAYPPSICIVMSCAMVKSAINISPPLHALFQFLNSAAEVDLNDNRSFASLLSVEPACGYD